MGQGFSINGHFGRSAKTGKIEWFSQGNELIYGTDDRTTECTRLNSKSEDTRELRDGTYYKNRRIKSNQEFDDNVEAVSEMLNEATNIIWEKVIR